MLGSCCLDIRRWPTLLMLATLGSICGSQPATAGEELYGESAAELVQDGKDRLQQNDHSRASDSFSRAVELIERQSGPASKELLEPLLGLADVSIALRQPGVAIDNLQRAVTIVRRDAGLYAWSQYALLLKLADLQSLVGDVDAAAASLGYMKRVSESEHGSGSVSHGLALAQIAEWQCRIGRFEEGRRHYRQGIILLDTRGAEEGRIDALLGLARCCMQELSSEGIATTPMAFERYRGSILRSAKLNPDSPAFQFHVTKFLRPEGEAAVRRAVLLAETTPVDVQRRIDALVQAGDWFQMKDHMRTARGYYAKAQQMSQADQAGGGPDDPFSAPLQLLYPVPPMAMRYRDLPETATIERFVEVEFVVRADGRADAERVIERGPGKSSVDEMMSALNVARFRPRVVDGKAVDTEGVRLRQGFREQKAN